MYRITSPSGKYQICVSWCKVKTPHLATKPTTLRTLCFGRRSVRFCNICRCYPYTESADGTTAGASHDTRHNAILSQGHAVQHLFFFCFWETVIFILPSLSVSLFLPWGDARLPFGFVRFATVKFNGILQERYLISLVSEVLGKTFLKEMVMIQPRRCKLHEDFRNCQPSSNNQIRQVSNFLCTS